MPQPIIIGGGIAGLMAALHLAERGLKPLVLEADPDRIGGRLQDGPTVTFTHQGQRWSFPGEHGVHGIWSPYVNFKAALSRHHLLPALVPAREETWIYGRGRRVRRAAIGRAIRHSLIPAPFHYLRLFFGLRFLNILTLRDLAGMFRVLGSLLSAMSIDPITEHKALTGMSLADFMAGWSPTLRSLFTGLARSALAAQPEAVPASGFIAFLRFYTLLRRDAWQFDYLPGPGGSCVAQPLADRLVALGGEIRLGVRVVALQMDNHLLYESLAGDGALPTGPLILALDAPAAHKLLAASPRTATQTGGLHFPQGIPTAIIRLWFERLPHSGAEAGIYTGDFVMDNFFWLHRLQPAYTAWSKQTGGSALEMHIYGPPERLAQPDAALLAQVITDTYRAYPELRGHLLHAVLRRNPASHTLFSLGEPGRHLAVETPWPGLYACGDWIYHPAPALYLERATTTGIAAANALLASLGHPTWPLRPHPQPEWLAGKIAAGLQRFRQSRSNHNRARRGAG